MKQKDYKGRSYTVVQVNNLQESTIAHINARTDKAAKRIFGATFPNTKKIFCYKLYKLISYQ